MNRLSNLNYIAIFFILLFNVKHAFAIDGISLGLGAGDASINAYRIALDWRWPVLWCGNCAVNIGGYLEGSFAHLDGKASSNLATSNSSLNAYALAPVFRFISRDKLIGIKPYFEGAIGLAWLSESEIGGRQLGLHGQFEDRFSIGALFGGSEHIDMNLRFMHFSNGFLGEDNHGINIYYVNLIYWL